MVSVSMPRKKLTLFTIRIFFVLKNIFIYDLFFFVPLKSPTS